MAKSRVSIVIPVFNSERTIRELVDQIESFLAGKIDFDIILINDGSPDRSIDVLRDLSINYENVCVINLSRNFGQHNAIMAGLNYAKGDYIITMDDDLQHPVEGIIKLVDELEKGYDVVYGEYQVKKHSLFKNLGSELNNLMGNVIIKKPKDLRFTSFRIIRSFVVQEMIKYRGPYPYLDGIILRVTRNIGTVTVEHKVRAIGRSNYTLKKLINLWLNGFLNFSIVPLRFFTYIGIIFAIIGFFSALIIMAKAILFYVPIEGWTSLIVSTLIFSGVQLLSIGLVGEYIGRLYLSQNGTPQYIIKEQVGSRSYEK
jgi:undecaprenyl-phosphate 4-deoxy-4-formamido-L-arabinose transferase